MCIMYILLLGTQRLYTMLSIRNTWDAIWFVCLSKLQSYGREIQFQGMRSVCLLVRGVNSVKLTICSTLKKLIKPQCTYASRLHKLLYSTLYYDAMCTYLQCSFFIIDDFLKDCILCRLLSSLVQLLIRCTGMHRNMRTGLFSLFNGVFLIITIK